MMRFPIGAVKLWRNRDTTASLWTKGKGWPRDATFHAAKRQADLGLPVRLKGMLRLSAQFS